MESFIFDLIKIFLGVLFLLGLTLTAIWFYFRIKPKASRESEIDRPDAMTGKEVITTLKLQACERLILFLERITPNNLILRVHTPDMSAAQLQGAMIRTVREEFEYNLSQQLYLTSKTWELIRSAKEEILRQINTAASGLKEGGSARDLAGAILQLSLSQERSPVSTALEAIKNEIRKPC
ncbi:MAG: hypothetical protein ISS17_08730 [Bacteroidales bacterium]|nr:hypothetical protein [Bacteroidales bacterium]